MFFRCNLICMLVLMSVESSGALNLSPERIHEQIYDGSDKCILSIPILLLMFSPANVHVQAFMIISMLLALKLFVQPAIYIKPNSC